MGNALEYDEYDGDDVDDLFGDGDGDGLLGYVDDRVPVVTENRPVVPTRTPSPVGSSGWPTVDQRLKELEACRRLPEPHPLKGVDTLRAYTMLIVRANSSRIWNIGGLEYGQIAEMLDELPRDQLTEVEEQSPHIIKDTDWLWEIFMLREFPLFHERCREKKGERRTSGWRRMFEKAQKDAEERKASALSRVAERYAEMDAQRASKKIVVLNEFVAPQKGRKGHSLATARRGARAAASYAAAAPTKAQTAISKARADAQRARVALTHSSGKFIPQAPRIVRPGGGDSQMYSNPFLGQSSASSSRFPTPTSSAPRSRMPTPTPGPRLPPPRVARSSTLPGAYPTGQANAVRAALPPHLGTSTASPTRVTDPSDSVPSRMRTIHKPEVTNFVPAQPTSKRMDFFGGAEPASKRLKTELRKVRKDVDAESEAASTAAPSPAPTDLPSTTRTTPSNSPRPRPPQRKPVGASVLFVKKKRPLPRP